MPRVSPSRTLTNERSLARRIEHERTARNWTYEGFAQRMADAGYPIQPSAIYKIEKRDRRITVDELVGFAAVLGTEVENLLLPPEAVVTEEMRRLVTSVQAARRAFDDAIWAYRSAQGELVDYVAEHPALLSELAANGLDQAELIDVVALLVEDTEERERLLGANREGVDR